MFRDVPRCSSSLLQHHQRSYYENRRLGDGFSTPPSNRRNLRILSPRIGGRRSPPCMLACILVLSTPNSRTQHLLQQQQPRDSVAWKLAREFQQPQTHSCFSTTLSLCVCVCVCVSLSLSLSLCVLGLQAQLRQRTRTLTKFGNNDTVAQQTWNCTAAAHEVALHCKSLPIKKQRNSEARVVCN